MAVGTKNKSYREFYLKDRVDSKGSLVSIEEGDNSPFKIKRVFYIFDTKGNVVRGCHANRKSQFILISIKGSCKVKIKDSHGIVNVMLDSPIKALWLDKMVWKEMYDFSPDCTLLVLSSEPYDKDEYIFDYKIFLEEEVVSES